MATPLSDQQARAALDDPQTPAATLQAIAADHPDLWVQVAQHPKAYPGLLDWLDEGGDPEVSAAVAQRREQDAQQDAASEPAPVVMSRVASWTQRFAPSRLRVVAVVVAVLVVLAVVLAFLLPRHQTQDTLSSALGDFQAAVTTYDAAQTTLKQAIDDADPATKLSATDVANPDTLSTLTSALASAKADVGTAPAPATTASAVRRQISTLEAKTSAATKATAELRQAVDAAQASQVTAAQAGLAKAADDAEKEYTAYQGKADQASLTALQQQLDQARQAATATPSDDPATTLAAIQQQRTALSYAVSAVVASATPPCGGVSVPNGVDSKLVCGAMPTNTVTIAPATDPSGAESHTFTMPSGNIACTAGADAGITQVMCQIRQRNWTTPSALQTACQTVFDAPASHCRGTDVALVKGSVTVMADDAPDPWGSLTAAGISIATLPYGQTTSFGSLGYPSTACQSSSSGILCWDTGTHHGFLMSTQQLKTW